VNGVALAPNGKSFAAATEKGVTCWDASTDQKMWAHELKDGPAFALAYTPDGSSVWVAGQAGVIRLDAYTGKVLTPYENAKGVGFENFVRKTGDLRARALAFSRDGKKLAFSDGYMSWMVEPEDPANHGTFGGPAPKGAEPGPASVAWSPDGKQIACIRPKRTERTFPSGLVPDTHWPVTLLTDTGQGWGQSALLGHDHRVTALAWSNDGKLLASGDEKGTVIGWDPKTRRQLWRQQFCGRDRTDGRINALAIAPTDNTVAVAVSMGSGKGAERVTLLAATDGKELESLMRPWHLPVSCVAWSNDGTLLVTGCGAAGQVVTETKPLVGEVVLWERRKP
jgi:WD40 repeat protein